MNANDPEREKKGTKRYDSQMNSFKKTRDYQSQQEAFMLGILNQFCGHFLCEEMWKNREEIAKNVLIFAAICVNIVVY